MAKKKGGITLKITAAGMVRLSPETRQMLVELIIRVFRETDVGGVPEVVCEEPKQITDRKTYDDKNTTEAQ